MRNKKLLEVRSEVGVVATKCSSESERKQVRDASCDVSDWLGFGNKVQIYLATLAYEHEKIFKRATY